MGVLSISPQLKLPFNKLTWNDKCGLIHKFVAIVQCIVPWTEYLPHSLNSVNKIEMHLHFV